MSVRPLASDSVSVKVIVVVPLLPSLTLGEFTDSTGGSSSVMVSITDAGAVTPVAGAVIVPDSVTVTSSASRGLSTAVTVMPLPELAVWLAGMVSVVPLRVTADAGLADTLIVVAVATARLMVAVSVALLLGPLSSMVAGVRLKVTAGRSSSTRVRVAVAVPVRPPVADPVTVMVSSPSASISSVGVMLKVVVPLFWPAAMAMPVMEPMAP